MRWQCVAVLAGLIVAICGSLPAADSDELTKITSIEGMTEYRLGNGLKVLLFPDASQPTVTVNLTMFVGSRHEGYGEAGMAHLLEHMLFKGTPTHQQIPKVLKARGAAFNGTTWFDRTNYYETLPASDDNLDFALRLEADRMVNSFVKESDLRSEMSVVRNEFERGENSPVDILEQRMVSAAFEWHNYGRATIGNRADIERVPATRLRKFYKKYYRPDNAMLVVAGKFDATKALGWIRKYFGAIPRPKSELDATYTQEPPQDGERFVTLRRVGDVAVVGALYHICSGAHPDHASVDVLNNILTDEPSGRLYKALVESRKAANVFGSAFAMHDPGFLRILAMVSKGNDPNLVLGAMLDVIEQVAKQGVSDAEVERARQRLLKRRELAAASSKRIAIQLSEWAAQGDWRLYFLNRDRIEKVTAQSVKDVAVRYLQRNNRTVGLFIPTEQPQKVSIPQTPELAQMIGDYKGREAISAGEEFAVTPENIDARTRRLTLPSGIKVALLEKKTRGQAVYLRLTLRYGDEKSLRGLTTACEFLPHLMIRGMKHLSRQQLQDELDKHRARMNVSGQAGTATFAIQTKRESLSAVLELLRQVLREATLPQKELDILKQGQVDALQRKLKEPRALSTRLVRRKLYPVDRDDPRYIPAIAEEIEIVKAITLSTVFKLYVEYLGAQAGELAVVGDFDPQKTLPVVQQMLSGWEASRPYAHLQQRVNPKAKGSAEEILTPGKANAMYFAAQAFPLRDDHPDYAALVIGNFILGGGSLSSRLGDRVRQKDGLSYGVGSGFQARSLDHRAAFYTYAICNPDNMDKVKIAIREEIERLLKDGATEEELQNAQQGYLKSQEMSRANDSRLVRILGHTQFAGRTMQYHAELEQKIRGLTLRKIETTMRKHIDPKKLISVAAGDFNKKPAEVKQKRQTKKPADAKTQ